MSLDIDSNLRVLSDPGAILIGVRLVPGLFNCVRIPEVGSTVCGNDGDMSCCVRLLSGRSKCAETYEFSE